MLTVPKTVHVLVPVRQLPPLSGLLFSFCIYYLLILILRIFSSGKFSFALQLALDTLPYAAFVAL